MTLRPSAWSPDAAPGSRLPGSRCHGPPPSAQIRFSAQRRPDVYDGFALRRLRKLDTLGARGSRAARVRALCAGRSPCGVRQALYNMPRGKTRGIDVEQQLKQRDTIQGHGVA